MTKFVKQVAAAGAAFLLPVVAFAQVNNPLDSTIGSSFGLGTNTDVRTAVINVVAYILSFLGLIAVLIVLYAGYLWMTAGGNEEKVEKARTTLTAGVIGLVIILAAYALTQFVIGQISAQIGG